MHIFSITGEPFYLEMPSSEAVPAGRRTAAQETLEGTDRRDFGQHPSDMVITADGEMPWEDYSAFRAAAESGARLGISFADHAFEAVVEGHEARRIGVNWYGVKITFGVVGGI